MLRVLINHSFQDCVLCDGKTMNVCHLLLPSGRPCQHDRQKPSMVEGVVHTFCIRWCSPTVCNQSAKSKPQTDSQDEGWFSSVGLHYAEAAALGVLPKQQNSLYKATISS